MKKLIILGLLIFTAIHVDAQKKYKRKIRIEVEDQDTTVTEDESWFEEDDDDSYYEDAVDEAGDAIPSEDTRVDDRNTEIEVIEMEEDEDGNVDISIATKPLGRYLSRSKTKKVKAVEFEPMTLIGWNGMDLDQYENNIMGGIKDFSDMNMKAATSWYVAFYPLGIHVNLYRQQLKLVTGMGVQFYNYKFSDSVVFSTESPYPVNHYSSADFKKTKLGSSYLSIPLLLQYNTRPVRNTSNFSIGGGIIFGYRLKTWTKMKLDNGTKIVGPKGNYNFNNYVYSAAFMVGFKHVKIFGTYMLTPLHRAIENYSVDAYPWTIGLML